MYNNNTPESESKLGGVYSASIESPPFEWHCMYLQFTSDYKVRNADG